jgi:hypothetical protein
LTDARIAPQFRPQLEALSKQEPRHERLDTHAEFNEIWTAWNVRHSVPVNMPIDI